MILTLQDALDKAKEIANSDKSLEAKKAELINIIKKKLDAAGDMQGKTTILYGGEIDGKKASAYIKQYDSDAIRHIGKTDVGAFVNALMKGSVKITV